MELDDVWVESAPPVAPEEQPPTEIRLAASEVGILTPPEEPVAPPPQTEAETVDKAHGGFVETVALPSPPIPVEPAVAATAHALVSAAAPTHRLPESPAKPQSLPGVVTTPSARPFEMSDLSSVPRPERDVHIAPATPPVAQAKPMTADRAPTLMQLQLLASDQASTQTEARSPPRSKRFNLSEKPRRHQPCATRPRQRKSWQRRRARKQHVRWPTRWQRLSRPVDNLA